MATPNHAGGTDGSDRKIPTQDEYESTAFETRWVDLEDGDGSFQVREMSVMRVVRDMERYGVKGLMSGGGSINDDQAQDLAQNADVNGFIDNTVLPNILQPNCYWTVEVDDGPDRQIGDGDFDLSALSKTDLAKVVQGMVGDENDGDADLGDDADESFLGE